MITIQLNEKPLSVNNAWQGRRFKTNEYRNYEAILLALLPYKKEIKGPVDIRYVFHLKNIKMKDVDNCIKPLQDILEKAGYFENDRMIYRFTAEKIESKKDSIEIYIQPYETHLSKRTKK